MSPRQAAKQSYQMIEKKRLVTIPDFSVKMLVIISSIFPYGLIGRLTRKMAAGI